MARRRAPHPSPTARGQDPAAPARLMCRFRRHCRPYAHAHQAWPRAGVCGTMRLTGFDGKCSRDVDGFGEVSGQWLRTLSKVRIPVELSACACCGRLPVVAWRIRENSHQLHAGERKPLFRKERTRVQFPPAHTRHRHTLGKPSVWRFFLVPKGCVVSPNSHRFRTGFAPITPR